MIKNKNNKQYSHQNNETNYNNYSNSECQNELVIQLMIVQVRIYQLIYYLNYLFYDQTLIFAHLNLTVLIINCILPIQLFKSYMKNQSVLELLDIANKVYTQMDSTMNRTEPNPRFANALGQIKQSIDELNKLSTSIEWQKGSEINQVLKFIEQQNLCKTEKRKRKLVSKKSKDKIKKEEDQQNSGEGKQNILDDSKSGRGPYRQYTVELKESAQELHKNGLTYSRIAKLLRIPSKNIIRWCKHGAKRKPGAGRKVMDPEMQINLSLWIENNFKIKGQVPTSMVRNKAKQFCRFNQFQASHGWFKNFTKRYNLRQMYEFY